MILDDDSMRDGALASDGFIWWSLTIGGLASFFPFDAFLVDDGLVENSFVDDGLSVGG